MIDSLRYGLPLGLVAFAAWWSQFAWFPEASPLWRWSGVAIVGCAVVGWSVRERNRAYFPFRYAFLTLFNVLIAATLVVGVAMYVLHAEWIGEAPVGVSEPKWVLSHVYIEAMGFLFVALITAAILSWLFRRKKT